MTSLQSVCCAVHIMQGDVALSSGEYIKEKFRQSFRLKATAVNLYHATSSFRAQLYTCKDLLQQMNNLGL